MNEPEVEEIARKVWATYVCRLVHLTYDMMVAHMMGSNWPDAQVCEFGNTEEHCAFFAVTNERAKV